MKYGQTRNTPWTKNCGKTTIPTVLGKFLHYFKEIVVAFRVYGKQTQHCLKYSKNEKNIYYKSFDNPFSFTTIF